MTGTYLENEDPVFQVVSDCVAANSLALIGYVVEIRWPGIAEPEAPDMTKSWLRVSRQTVMSTETGFVAPEIAGGSGRKRYTVDGLLFVQAFGTKTDETAWNALQLLGQAIVKALRIAQTTPKVIFRNVRLAPLAPETKWYRLNVIAETEYDEIY